IRKRTRATRFFHRTDELVRALERDHFAGRPDNFRKIDSRITRAGADIEHATANSDASLLPGLQSYWAPDAMLQSESRNLLVVCAENVVALRCHSSNLACLSYQPHRILAPPACRILHDMFNMNMPTSPGR